jgi:hypothetical protein
LSTPLAAEIAGAEWRLVNERDAGQYRLALEARRAPPGHLALRLTYTPAPGGENFFTELKRELLPASANLAVGGAFAVMEVELPGERTETRLILHFPEEAPPRRTVTLRYDCFSPTAEEVRAAVAAVLE